MGAAHRLILGRPRIVMLLSALPVVRGTFLGALRAGRVVLDPAVLSGVLRALDPVAVPLAVLLAALVRWHLGVLTPLP